MPEHRLQRCRDAYPRICKMDFEKAWNAADPVARWLLLEAPAKSRRKGDASAAYRITQAQLAADQRIAGDERL